MAVEAGAVFRDQIDIGVAVEIGDPAALAGDERNREWRVPKYSPRIAARQRCRGLVLTRQAVRVGVSETLSRLVQNSSETDIGAHVSSALQHSIKSPYLFNFFAPYRKFLLLINPFCV
ncbi:hypothetical protein [Mesorhizobium sp. LSJC285A00]|uniref:hypothetical protein n=1 Tax=Mesorhizobium sp. LSJC285A00 TaxID=1287338 RepID=UPI0018DDB17B|nr:hypothetical protein [Mesorhizobium sp. LSJC285A00]